MSLTILLDAGPLSLITNPKKTPITLAVAQWAITMRTAGHRFVVPAIADYKVRRELIRAGKLQGIAQLNAFNSATPDRFFSISCRDFRPGYAPIKRDKVICSSRTRQSSQSPLKSACEIWQAKLRSSS